MSDLKNVVKLLKFGATKKSYPEFGSYALSKNGKLITFNYDVLVSVDYDIGFDGGVNVYVLDGILSKVKDAALEKKGDVLNITDGSFSAKLNIIDIADEVFPEVDLSDVKFSDVTSEMLDKLKLASSFVAGDSTDQMNLDKVFFGNNVICGCDGHRSYIAKHNTSDNLSFNKQILQFLSEGMLVGRYKDSVAVKFENGFAVFNFDIAENYPVDQLVEIVDSSSKNSTKLCNIACLHDALSKLSPIFFGETFSSITLSNENNVLTVSANSYLNGETKIEYNSFSDTEISVDINPIYLKPIPIDFDVYLVDKNKIYLSNDADEEIIIMVQAE